MLWPRMQGALTKFANTISKTLDVDVLIVDGNLKVVGSTFRYFDQYQIVRRVSVIGQTITTGEVVAIEDRRKFSICQVCPEYDVCVMRGLISVPILYHDTVVGAIALILPQQRVGPIFRDADNSVEFLQNMAALLSSRLQDGDDYSALDVIKQEREILMDEVEYAIVSTDNLGVIVYHNRRFPECFGLERSCVGEMLYEVVPHRIISDFFSHRTTADNELISVESESECFYGLVTCKNITIKGRDSGAFFLFKPIQKISSDAERTNPNAKASFLRYENLLFSHAVADEAKRLAVGRKSILLQCPGSSEDLLLARCIHNYSDRSQTAMVTVECNSAWDIQEAMIFGEMGQLHMAHKGTIFFRNIDRLPYYLQTRLVDFLKERVLVHSGGSVRLDVRLLFSTSADLKALTASGAFCEQLYYRISEHILRMPPIGENQVQLRGMIDNVFRFFKGVYHKGGLILTEDVLALLCAYHWPGSVGQFSQVMDRLVHRAEEKTTLEDLRTACPAIFPALKQQSMEDLEREHINTLLRDRLSKEEMSKILGISRATLYRKIKHYGLD